MKYGLCPYTCNQVNDTWVTSWNRTYRDRAVCVAVTRHARRGHLLSGCSSSRVSSPLPGNCCHNASLQGRLLHPYIGYRKLLLATSNTANHGSGPFGPVSESQTTPGSHSWIISSIIRRHIVWLLTVKSQRTISFVKKKSTTSFTTSWVFHTTWTTQRILRQAAVLLFYVFLCGGSVYRTVS